jgi:catechol 2,3-dioxygenase-like lactoylglutathione lyase family enzyme
MRLRQIALVAPDLEPAVADLCAVLGVEVGFRDPGVGIFGLENAVMPIGDTFLEVVAPVRDDTTAGRFLARRGAGGYMVMVQCDDLDADRRRLDSLGVRVVWSIELDDIRGMHLHPRDVGAAILSLDQPVPPESWRWAGPEWREHVRADACRRIVAAELQGVNPEAMARRWAEVLGKVATAGARSDTGRPAWRIPLGDGEIRFVDADDGRGEGLGAFDVEVADGERVRASARTRGAEAGHDSLQVGGIRIRLRGPG